MRWTPNGVSPDRQCKFVLEVRGSSHSRVRHTQTVRSVSTCNRLINWEMLNGMQAEKPSQAMDQQCRARRQHPSIYHPTHHPPSPDGAGTHTALFQGAAALVIGLPYGGVAAMDPRSNPDSVWEHPSALIPTSVSYTHLTLPTKA